MLKYPLLVGSLMWMLGVQAQKNLVHVRMDRWAKDERFDRMMNPVAFYFTEGDTIRSGDLEESGETEPIVIKRPPGYKSYAYGYVFFKGVHNPRSPGQITLLLANVKERNPLLFIDRNCNADFTDDGTPDTLPGAYTFTKYTDIILQRADQSGGAIAIRLSRLNFSNKYEYRQLLNEHYSITAGDRKFVGIEYCLREQRFTARSGIFNNGIDSFSIALQDMNGNGRYNDNDTDRVMAGNVGDTTFDGYDDLHGFVLKRHQTNQYIERNGEQFEILQIDGAGQYIVVRQADSTEQFDKWPVGKKLKKFVVTDWNGVTHKIKKFRNKQVYLYFSGMGTKGFSADTALLRKLAHEFNNQLVVIGFIDVRKSYELTIFGTYSNLNWIAAFKDKYVIQDLRMRGMPSSLLLAKKRRVSAYNLTPQQLYERLSKGTLK